MRPPPTDDPVEEETKPPAEAESVRQNEKGGGADSTAPLRNCLMRE